MAKILICIPAMDMVATGFCQSLTMLQKAGNECSITFECGSLIYDARNKLAARALQMGAEYVMWFDSDMIFEPDTMVKLLKADKDIVSGLYFRRSPPYTLVAFDELDIEARKWTDAKIPDKITKVGGVGFGCVLMKTDVLFEIASKFKTWFEPLNGFGEDLSFCWRAKQCGYDVWLDPSVSCGHVGHVVVTEAMSRAINGGKKDEGKS